MKNLNLIFDLFLFPFLFLMRFVLFHNQCISSNWKQRKKSKRGSIALTYLIVFGFALTNIYADSNGNGSCGNAEIIEEMNNITTSTNHKEDGHVNNNGNDYYKFTINTPGSLNVNIAAQDPDNRDYTFYIANGTCGTWNIYNGNTPSLTHTKNNIVINAGDTIYVRVHANGHKTKYRISLNFTANAGVDEITSFNAPSEVTEGETITVTVSYNVSQERQIVTGFQQNHSPWDGWGWTTVNVPAGIGTVNIPVDIPTGQPLSNGYQIPIVLEPVGGDWDSRLDNKAQNPVNLIPNQPPTANSQSLTVDENSTNNAITLTGDDPDGDNSALNYAIVTAPSHGTLSCSNCNNPTYTPTAGYHGADSFIFKVNDGTDDSSDATVSITVTEGTSIPIDPNFTQCGLFPSALNTWQNINRGNGDIIIDADTIFADNVIGSGNQDIKCTNGGTISNCSIEKMALNPITLPTFITSPTSTAYTTSSTETGRDYGNVTVNSDTHFSPSDTYADSSSHLMLMNSLTINNGATVTFDEGDYWIGTLTANASTKIRTTGKVRFFVDSALDLTQNHLDINYDGGDGLAKNLFIFVYGNFEFASNGGGDTQDITAYVYVEGDYTANFNTANSHYKGAVTSVGNINLNNNQEYTYDDAGLIGGWGECNNPYCSSHNLSEGFHIIDPDGGSNKNSFEIFCHKDANDIWHDLIALPMKNSSNNFLFNSNTTTSNYYDTSANPRTDFNAIEIDGGHITYNGTKPSIPVITTRSDEPWQITTDGHTYNVLGSKFSNINLIGTPFKIDWANTGPLENCDESLLRKALGQAVKYNTINTDNGTSNDGKSRCKITTMNLTLLDDYQYLTYNSEEVLQHSCKEMATYVPNNILSDSSIDGHFNILTSEPTYPIGTIPTTNGSRDNATDIGATNQRPITVYCKYQTDLGYVWTFLTALDAKVTKSKNDLVNHQDTCSELGLFFYVPNNKETFDRVRKYLKNSKNGDDGWENYTGTINEKIQAFHPGNQYYLSAFRDVKIWPYGPLGVYYPCNGNKDANNNCSDRAWYPGNTAQKGWMSGSPMHNITSMTNYSDSLGKKGWVSILGSQDLNKTDDWWIADIGAGEEIGNSSPQYSPHGSHPIQSAGFKYYEPNGNYTANAWLNFIYDSEGWIYHADDWNNNYPYYDYMCMSETNYDTASRYTLVPGFFNVIERGTRPGNTNPNFSDDNITTQIVAKPIQLDLILYKLDPNTLSYDKTQLETDQNKSVGVFISTVNGNNLPVPIKYLGEYQDFSGHNGRIQIPDFTIPNANKRAVVQFYYCNAADTNWRSCWNYNDNPNSPTISSLEGGGHSDSADDFAVRPDRFSLTAAGETIVKAKDVNITYYAYDYATNHPTTNYNETITSISAPLADTSKNCTNTALSFPNISFTDGIDTNATTLVNVGTFNIKIAENNGTEFALIDADDTPDSDRFITPSDINLTILPDHFHIDNPISQINNNNIGNFTYLANDLDKMAIKFDFNVTAQNSNNETTPNYSSQCYANNTNISLEYNATSIPAMLTKLYYKELNSNSDGNVTATDANLTDNLPKSIFTNDHNGTAEIKLRVNFSRNKNSSINPFKVNFTDLNISDQSKPPVKVGTDATHVIDTNATMLYGRSHAPRQIFKGYEGNATIYYESYCGGNDCNKSLLPDGITSKYSDDPRWFINTKHNTSKDGNISAVTQKNGTGVVTTNGGFINTIGLTKAPLIYGTATNPAPKGYPYKTTMDTNASSWLIYNKYNSNAMTNEFEVEFISPNGDWAGVHETNATTNRNASDKTNRRLMW